MLAVLGRIAQLAGRSSGACLSHPSPQPSPLLGERETMTGASPGGPLKLRLALLVLAASSCSHDLTLPAPPPVTGFITGRVVVAVPGTSQSVALPGATVAVLSSNLHATTDERGQFLLGPLPEGGFRLFFSA